MIRSLARTAVGHPVAANLLMAAVLLMGALAYRAMPREVFPDFSLDAVEVFTVYPGAAPEDVERLVTTPLEDALRGLDGVDTQTSVSREGTSRLRLTLLPGTDVSRFLAEARDRLRAGDLELPEDAEEPRVFEAQNRFPVIAVFVYGSASERELLLEAERQRRALEELPDVARVDVTGDRKAELRIDVDPRALERFGLTLSDVERAVAARTREVPLGTLELARGESLLRLGGDAQWGQDLVRLPLVSTPDGRTVTLGEVARPRDDFERALTRGRFNGFPAVHMQVLKTAEGDTIDIAAQVRDYVRDNAAALPPGLELGTNSDLSVYVRNRLVTLGTSALYGAALVLLALLLFLTPKVALATALGVPVAFMGGLALAHALGVTMNMIAMFALIVVLGMVVDDAIVVGENIFRRIEEGEAPRVAAVRGTLEVGAPVVATVLTSVAAFLPVLMLGGTTGRFLAPLPIIVAACLLFSLVEALTILPAHMAHWGSRARSERERGAAPPTRWYTPLQAAYVAILERALRQRLITLGVALGGAAIVAAVSVARIPFQLFDEFESKLFYVSLRLDPGASLDETARVAAEVERRVLALPREELESAHTLLGVAASNASSYELAPHLAQVWIELREGAGRRRSTAEIMTDVRARLVGLPPEVVAFELAQPQTNPGGRALQVSLVADDFAALAGGARAVRERLERFAGVRDLTDDLELGKEELALVLNDNGRALGLSEARLAAELRGAFEGREVAELRRGSDAVAVVVGYERAVRRDPAVLETLRVSLPSGGRVPLASVVEVSPRRGLAALAHDEGRRAVTLTADVDESVGSAARILAELASEVAGLTARFPGLTVRFGGEARESARALDGLAEAGVLALALIYVVLGTLFRSYLQPFIVMFIIPFAGVGMVGGHLLMGRSITLMSLIGLLALAGVVVNDALILVDFVNERRRAGAPAHAALMEAGRLRFRPILLTSLTTMLGLVPLTFFAAGEARFLQPMAISIFFGLGAATVLVLILVPVVYALLDDLSSVVKVARRSHRAQRA
ncbi:MAG: efflux RND transporter permease subunit [Planctomycetota bacterium]